MKLITTRSNLWFPVDWWLMNHCSWHCSYCHDIIKNSSIKLPDIRDCYRFVDSLSDFVIKKNRIAYFNFTGGEVTEWNEFPYLIEYCRKQKSLIKFRSNANTSTEIWKHLMKNVDQVTMEVHPEHTSVSSFLLRVGLAVDENVRVTVNINMDKNRWKELEDLSEKIKNKYSTVDLFKKMLFEDPIKNTTPVEYDQSQIMVLKKQTGDLLFEDENGDQEFTDYQTLVLEEKNKFKNWCCFCGLEQIVVDAYGTIYKGHCRMDGPIGSLGYPEIRWPNDPTSCKKDRCANSFDINSTKLL